MNKEICVVKRDGSRDPLNTAKIENHVNWACEGLKGANPKVVIDRAGLMMYDGIESTTVQSSLIMAAAQAITANPDYSKVAARLTLQEVYKQVRGKDFIYPQLSDYINKGIRIGRLTDELMNATFNYPELEAAIKPERDLQFDYLGFQTVVDRYLIRDLPKSRGIEGDIIEMPQHLFMRVAMGLAMREDNPTQRAIEFYNLLSSFDFMSSTPTLFNSGTIYPQLSSCYLQYVPDDLYEIFNTGYTETGQLSKYAGGIGQSWSRVRSEGALIKSTNGKSSGVIPYLKILNDTAVAVNQGGKRKGAVAAYLEPWHADFKEFCEFKEFAGDEHRRGRDMFTAAWINDLLMERKDADQDWSFFSPDDVPQLHETYGDEFKALYEQAEADGLAISTMPAQEVWRKILEQLFRTGGPWITFKDECNRRSPQKHAGVVHSSNLCTEITLNTGLDETAVCNLGSVNLANHMDGRHLDLVKLQNTVRVGLRMLDNVIDINYYPSIKARNSNLRHRPVGMGVMGFAEALLMAGHDWESEAQLQFSDMVMEAISYTAIRTSCDLAQERGVYESFMGSDWSQGILPIHTAREQSTQLYSMDEWDDLAQKVANSGMRNSNLMAIAPTATIANIVGTTECIQPIYERQSVKENLSGAFDVFSPLHKYNRPDLVKTVWEVDQTWLVKAAARRQKWIDQSQSVNLYKNKRMLGRDLDTMYTLAWQLGLKTTYYLKVQKEGEGEQQAPVTQEEAAVVVCSIENGPDCEACQ